MAGELALSVIAGEEAARYRRMASSYARESPRKAGLLRLAASLLDMLAGELVAGRPGEATIERLESIARLLRWSGLPHGRLERIARMARRYTPAYTVGLEAHPGQLGVGVGGMVGLAVGEVEY
ncbi:MAG: hypothetical protein LRS49_05975 [Desulfurococcales archaeon]|nr:hypothetical protein [Desulfurococcales archaeon]